MTRILSALLAALAVCSATAANYVGDYAPGATIDCKFSTVRPSSMAPYTLAGSPTIAVYKDNGTTESTTGATLTTDFDSRTGTNHVRVTTGSDGTFYSSGSHFEVVLTAGSVDGVSVVGHPVCAFSLAKASALRPTTAGRTLDVTSGGNAGIDLDNVSLTNGAPAFGIAASGTLSGTHSSTTADLGSNAPSSDVDVIGKTLAIAGRAARLITDYNPSTGVATFAETDATPTNGDVWVLWDSAPGEAGSGGGLDAEGIRDAIGLASANLDTQLATIDGNVDAILDDTSSSGVVVASGSKTGYSLSSTQTFSNTGTWTGNVTGSVGSVTGNVGGTVNGLTATAQGNVRTAVGLSSANLDAQLGAIVADTGTDLPALLDALDGLIDAIKAKTDQLTFSETGHVDANIKRVNDVQVAGDGQEGSEWGPAE